MFSGLGLLGCPVHLNAPEVKLIKNHTSIEPTEALNPNEGTTPLWAAAAANCLEASLRELRSVVFCGSCVRQALHPKTPKP